MEKRNAELAEVEKKLTDAALYYISRKAEMSECLQRQNQAKPTLEETEMLLVGGTEVVGKSNPVIRILIFTTAIAVYQKMAMQVRSKTLEISIYHRWVNTATQSQIRTAT